MTQFLLNKTESYTLVVSTETGNAKLVLADGLSEALKAAAQEASSPDVGIGALLDILGKDADAYLAAVGELAGVGGDFAQAYAEGGSEGLAKMVSDLGMDGNGDFFDDAIAKGRGEGDYFDQFADATGGDVADMLGFGPQFGDAFAEEGSAEGAAAIEALLGQGGNMQYNGGDDVSIGGFFGTIVEAAAYTIGGGLAGGLVGGAAGTVIPGAGNAAGATAGAVVGTAAGFAYGMSEVVEYGSKFAEKLNNEIIPAEPGDDIDTSGLLGAFDLDKKIEEGLEQAGATYGKILVDPNSESGGGVSLKDFDPEAELNSLILTNPEDVQKAITGAEIKAAVELKLATTTTPVDAVEIEFDFSGFDAPTEGTEGAMSAKDDGMVIAGPNPVAGVVDMSTDTFIMADLDLPTEALINTPELM